MRLRAALTAGFAALALAAPAQADTFTVTNGSSDSTAACTGTTCPSLRAAIAASEATKDVADVINVPAGTININNDLVVQSDITINGVSARTNIIDGGAKYRGLRVSSAGNAKLNHFTIRNGAGGGGGLAQGGGVVNQGIAALDQVRVTGSSAGGVANLAGGRLAIQHSLIDANTGGGVLNVGGAEITPITITQIADSTIFANTGAIGGPGGIVSTNQGLLTVLRSTIADNTGGVRATAGGLQVALTANSQVIASILARNKTDAGATVNCGATRPTDGGANVEDNDTCGFTFTGNPGLDTKLANAGGDVDVLPLAATSPAVDRIPNGDNCPAGTLDQRSLYRPQGSACDSGAFELDQAATFTITSGPSGTVSTPDVQFGFSSSEPGANPVCQLTGPGQSGGFAACYKSNAQPYAGLANGTYTFSVRDGAFPTATPTTRTFTVAALDTTITAGPSGLTNTATPTFSFTGVNGAVSFQCRVDTDAFAPCTSPFTTATQSQGLHTFEVRAQSASGAPDPTPASRSFTVDTVPPNTTLTPITTPTNDNTPTFAFTSEAGATFQCRVDGSAYAPCTSPLTTGALADGSHTFDVRSRDAAGNVDPTPATQTFTVDTTPPPAPDVVSGPSGPTTDSAPQFSFSATGAETTECRLDGPAGAVGAYGACTSPKAFSGLAPGDYVFLVRSTDAAGNTRVTQRAFTVTAPLQATPTPTPTVTANQTQPPVANQSVGAKPVAGTVLVKQPGAKTFVPLSPSLIRNGAEVDARNGVVEITRSDGGVARFYDGIFKLSHSGGYTVLTLTEKLTGCPKAKKSMASIAAKKPKSRKLWGDGKGKFRTKGQYSAATVRGTKWLVQDGCTTTLTRVAQGVVEVQDFVKRIKKIVRAPKSYTARAKKQ